jgi:hypothetical protein
MDSLPSRHFHPRKLFAHVRTFESYGLVLIAIILTIGVTAAGDLAPWWRLFVAFSQGMTLLLTLWTSHARRSTFVLVLGSLMISFAVVLLQAFLGGAYLIWQLGILNFLLVAVTPIAIVRRLITDRVINWQTILGALCIYLLLGLFFADLYALLSLFVSTPVLLSLPHATLGDYLYFSFITLTTTGYGDLTPQNGIARSLAVTEALSGQLYLVTILALLVGNFGKPHLREK